MAASPAVLEKIASDVATTYRILKQRFPGRRVDFSAILLEKVKLHGFRSSAEIADVRAKVARLMASRRATRRRT